MHPTGHRWIARFSNGDVDFEDLCRLSADIAELVGNDATVGAVVLAQYLEFRQGLNPRLFAEFILHETPFNLAANALAYRAIGGGGDAAREWRKQVGLWSVPPKVQEFLDAYYASLR